MDKIPPPPKSLTTNPHSLERPGDNQGTFSNKSQFSYGCNNRLDEELMKLRREMVGLRQLDLSLLSQLNALRQSILEYKQILGVSGSDDNAFNDNHDENIDNQYNQYEVPRYSVNPRELEGEEYNEEDNVETSDDEREEDGEEETSEKTSSESTV